MELMELFNSKMALRIINMEKRAKEQEEKIERMAGICKRMELMEQLNSQMQLLQNIKMERRAKEQEEKIEKMAAE